MVSKRRQRYRPPLADADYLNQLAQRLAHARSLAAEGGAAASRADGDQRQTPAVEQWLSGSGRVMCPVALHSITSSAMASRFGGILMPRVLTVLRLITSSNLVGKRTGRSIGFSPLRIRPV